MFRVVCVLLVWVSVVTATQTGAYLAELEHSVIGYATHGADIWNAYMEMLPVACVSDSILLARSVAAMTASLQVHKPVCQALGIGLQMVAGAKGFMRPRDIAKQVKRCETILLPGARGKEYILGTSSLMSALRVAHRIGRAVRPLTFEEEVTRAANINIMSAMNPDSEAVMRFDGQYKMGSLAQRATATAMNISQVKRSLRGI